MRDEGWDEGSPLLAGAFARSEGARHRQGLAETSR